MNTTALSSTPPNAFGSIGSWKSKASTATLASDTPGQPRRLRLGEYPRWAELVQRGLHLMPPALPRENHAILQGVLQLLHEHLPSPWSLTISEGNPDLSPARCKETRNHLTHTEDGWNWVPRHERHGFQGQTSMLHRMLEPATVAEHARLVRHLQVAPLVVYGWGSEGYIAVLNMAGVTLAVRDIPGMPEANEILLSRESMEGHALDRLDMHTVLRLFEREEAMEDSAFCECPSSLADDETEGLSAIPSAFMSMSKPREGNAEGILQYVNRLMRQAGPGNEGRAWASLRASDQYRFNVERMREMVVPGILENSPSHAAGAEGADMLLLMGVAHRFERSVKPLDGLGQKTLPEAAIALAAEHLLALRSHPHRSDDMREAVDQRLALLAQIWMHHCGEIAPWAPLSYRGQLGACLDAFMKRLTTNAMRA